MANEIDKLFFTIDADLSALREKFSEANNLGKQAASGLSSSFDGLTGTLTRLAGAFGIAFSVAGVISYTKEVISSTAALDNQARTMGVSTQALQAYRIAAIESGAGADAGDMAIQRLTRSIGAFYAGSGPARKAFDDLGLSAADLAGGTESALPKVANALLRIKDASQRAQVEFMLFGRSGQMVESFLKMWGDPNIIENMKKYGTSMTESQIKAMSEIDKRYNLLKLNIHNMWASATLDVIEYGKAVLAWLPHANMPGIGSTGTGSSGGGWGTGGGGGWGRDTGGVTFPFAGPNGPQPTWRSPSTQQASTANMDKYLADLRVQLQLSSLTGVALKEQTEAVKAADAILRDFPVTGHEYVKSLEDAQAILKAHGIKWTDIKNTVDATAEKLNMTDAFRQAGISEANMPGARSRLEAAFAPETLVKTAQQGLTPQALLAGRLPEGAMESGVREMALTKIPSEIAMFANQGWIPEQAREQLSDYMRGLQDEVKLAGMLPYQREQEMAVLRRKRQTILNEIEPAEEQEIRTLVAQKQQIEMNVEAGKELADALTGSIMAGIQPGAKFADILRQLEMSIANIIVKLTIMKPLEESIGNGFANWGSGGGGGGGGGFFSGIGSFIGSLFGGGGGDMSALAVEGLAASGMGFSRGRRFAAGGDVLNGPTTFASMNGPITGGEAGDEALIPLSRGPSGKLGVHMTGTRGGNVYLTQQISVHPDVSAMARAEVMRMLPAIGSYAMAGVSQAAMRS